MSAVLRTLGFGLVVVLLAGCASHAAPGSMMQRTSGTTATSASDADPRGGTVQGVVVSDEQSPLAGVVVSILKTDRRTTTDLEGRFAFASVAPGNYEVEARLGENDPVKVVAAVTEGATVDVTLVIVVKRAVAPEAYHELQIAKGHLGCNVAGTTCPGYPSPNEKQRTEHVFEGRPVSFLYEMTWDRFGPASPVPNDPPQPGWVDRWDVDVAGGNQLHRHDIVRPPYWRDNMTVQAGVTPASPNVVTVSSHPNGFLQVPGMAYEQDYTLYMSAFHLADRSATFCGTPPDKCPK